MRSGNGKAAAKFRVGDRVQFQMWGKTTWGTITEDRGNLGVNGRRLYYVSVPMDPDDPELHPMDEDELEPDSISRVPLEKSEIIDFLKQSGLYCILLANNILPLEYPLVWLCRDNHGKITYTFAPRRGLIGGQMIPDSALAPWGRRIDPRKKDEVAAYLLGFGLTPEEAEDVIGALGVAPVKPPRRRKAETA
jgi:hypothetical protein